GGPWSAAARREPRCGRRAAAAARRRDRGRPHRQPGPHPVHDPGRLSLPRPPPRLVVACTEQPAAAGGGTLQPRYRAYLMKASTFQSQVIPFVSSLLALLAAGCSVGPDYVRPDAPMSDTYKELGEWRPAQPRDDVLRTPWWEIYDDPVLSGLLAE